MGITVMIMGKSGSGKSRSLKSCVGKDFGLLRVINKPLPFKGKIGGQVTNDYELIKKCIKSPQWPKSIVIDDAGYLITGQFMDGHSTTGKGNGVFSLYNQLADDFYRLIKTIQDEVPEDRIVYVVMHEDVNDYGDIKPKTIGKLLDEKVCLEGMFTVVLRSVKSDRYVFITQPRDGAVSKAPDDMFEAVEIDNDLLRRDNMLDIPEEIKKLYKTSGSKQVNIKLSFYEEDVDILYPEDTLFPSEKLYPAEQTPFYVIENDQIVYESMLIQGAICESTDLVFGSCVAIQFDITVADVLPDLTGYGFTASMEVGGYEMMLGIYTVNKFEHQADRRKRKITAYNRMKKFKRDVADWYRGLQFPVTQRKLRDSLCDYVGVTQIKTTLPLDDMVITKTIDPESLGAQVVLKAICEVNGCFGFPDDNLFSV